MCVFPYAVSKWLSRRFHHFQGSNSSTKLVYSVNSHLPCEGALLVQNPMPLLVILLRHVQVCMCISYGKTEIETWKETQR